MLTDMVHAASFVSPSGAVSDLTDGDSAGSSSRQVQLLPGPGPRHDETDGPLSGKVRLMPGPSASVEEHRRAEERLN